MPAVKCNFGFIDSYAEAVRSWEKGIIFPKGRGGAQRGLVDNRKEHLTVEQDPVTQDIILRLYEFPAVTWHKDNSFTVRRWDSVSTSQFVNRCIPIGVYTCFTQSPAAVWASGRKYRIKDSLTFRWHEREQLWAPDKITPWEIEVLNKKRAAQALKETNYHTFRQWVKVYTQMTPQPLRVSLFILDTIAHLRDRSRWQQLAAYHPNLWNRPEDTLGFMRQVIYENYKCVDTISKPYLESGR